MRASIYCRYFAKQVIGECKRFGLIDDLREYAWIDVINGNDLAHDLEAGKIVFTKTQRVQMEKRMAQGLSVEERQLWFLARLVQDQIKKQIKGEAL
ncbi:hypothetical protein [Shimazuella kribbensis]|uniref:hypothetical protein n=1 Tax=Shimazuella kribbensis TaxID=139808 RepID=UPI0003FD880D|nr:hypothetical protein [Shimazuella kribbensis]